MPDLPAPFAGFSPEPGSAKAEVPTLRDGPQPCATARTRGSTSQRAGRERASGRLAFRLRRGGLELERSDGTGVVGPVERVGRPGDRQDYYRLADDAFEGLLQGAAERAARARQSIEKALTTMPEGEAGSRDRVRRYAAFYAAVESGLRHAAERMED